MKPVIFIFIALMSACDYAPVFKHQYEWARAVCTPNLGVSQLYVEDGEEKNEDLLGAKVRCMNGAWFEAYNAKEMHAEIKTAKPIPNKRLPY